MDRLNVFEKVPKRYILSLLGFLGFFNGYILRSNLSIAIVAMVDPTIQKTGNDTYTITPAPYDWNSATQGFILSSFFYTYLLMQLPAGYMATRFGGRTLFGGSIGLCGFFTLFTPLCAQIGAIALIILRLIIGICSGFMYPCMHFLWAKWAPKQDKATLTTFSFAGSYIGLFFAMILGGVIAEYWSWEWVFYLSGISTLIWTILWFYFAFESPSEHPTIHKEELTYITENLAPSMPPTIKIPWQSILTSPPVWACIFAHFATAWPIDTMLLELPTFFNQCLHYDLAVAGVLSAIPWLVFSITLYSTGLISDKLTEKFETVYIRKITFFLSFIFVIVGTLMIILPSTMYRAVIIVGVVISIGAAGLAWGTFGVNELDIGGHYAGILMGLSNTAAAIPGIAVPIIVGYVVPDKNSHSEWNYIFLIIIIICTVVLLFYVILGSGELQRWAKAGGDEYQVVMDNLVTPSNISDETQ